MRKLSITEEQLKQIEKYLLAALKNIDQANAILWDANEFLNDADKLLKLKGQIKTILNSNYDACARNKLSSDTFS